MIEALSLDLRQRIVAVVLKKGLSHREAAARFKLSARQHRPLPADGAVPVVGTDTPRQVQVTEERTPNLILAAPPKLALATVRSE